MSVAKEGGTNGASRLYLWLSIGIAIFFFIVPIAGGAYWTSSLENRVHALEQIAPSNNAAILSRIDEIVRRQELQDQVINKLEAAQSSNCQQFAKVETQFGTVETIINQTHVDDLRTRGAFWAKIFKEPYSDAFYTIQIPHEVVPCQ